MELIAVKATYLLNVGKDKSSGTVEFIARIKESTQGYNLTDRAKKAVVRRFKVKPPAVTITGVTSW